VDYNNKLNTAISSTGVESIKIALQTDEHLSIKLEQFLAADALFSAVPPIAIDEFRLSVWNIRSTAKTVRDRSIVTLGSL